MSRDPFDKIVNHVLSEIEDEIRTAQFAFSQGGSPIEAILETALLAITHYHGIGFPGLLGVDLLVPGKVYRRREYQVGRYRLDFAFCGFDESAKEWKWLAVECDGHAFHERTKQQAEHDRSRDRWLQEQGWVVYRFTGSELYRDPIRCAKQVVEWLFRYRSAGA